MVVKVVEGDKEALPENLLLAVTNDPALHTKEHEPDIASSPENSGDEVSYCIFVVSSVSGRIYCCNRSWNYFFLEEGMERALSQHMASVPKESLLFITNISVGT